MLLSYTTISFPNLGLEFNPPRFIEIGPLTIHFYGIIIAVGLLLAVLYGLRRKTQFGLVEDDILDGVLWIVPAAIIGTRLYYCIFSWDSYKDDLVKILHIWDGGLAIYGGVITAAICVVIHCKIKKISLPAVLDLVALGFLIGQSIGRWGNLINREAFGAETNTFLKMGLTDLLGNTTYHHPTFFYESMWNLVGFIALHFLSKKRQYDGQIALGYVAWYGLGRTIIEGMRTDSLYWGSVRVSQILAASTCFIAVAVLVVMAFLPHDRKNLYVNRRAAALAEAEAAAAAAEEEDPEETVEETAEEQPEDSAEEDTAE